MIEWNDINGQAIDERDNYTQLIEENEEIYIIVYNRFNNEIGRERLSDLDVNVLYEDDEEIELDPNDVRNKCIEVLEFYTR